MTALHRLRCVFMRGGTSKALMFHRGDLPARQEDWAPIFLAAMGAPDPNGRQLDGMGGGISSLSKVCVIGPPTHPDADVDYTFAQIGVDRATVDYGGNCGNMSSAIGPFAVDERLVPPPADGRATVRIHNTNTRKLIVSSFTAEGGRAAVHGSLAIDGVAGTGAPIRLEFRDLAGARTGRLLPTGEALQTLPLPDGRAVRASLVDAANPCAFVAAADLGLAGTETPESIEANGALMADLEALRLQAAVLMGLASDLAAAASSRSVPFIGMVAPPSAWRTRSGAERTAADADIAVRMLSSGNPHRAIPITSALCVAVACRTPGTLPATMCSAASGPLRVGHPSGTTMVEAAADARAGRVLHASVYRTARRLFQGEVLY
jgi:2-methylaconitate cis-trans-isomerase PrpF